jgi:hypothetical protein
MSQLMTIAGASGTVPLPRSPPPVWADASGEAAFNPVWPRCRLSVASRSPQVSPCAGSFGAVVPQPTAGIRAVGSPFRAKFPPEVRFSLAGNAVTVGNTSKLVLRPEPKQGIYAVQTAGWSRHPIEAGTVSADRPQPFLARFGARVNRPLNRPFYAATQGRSRL